MFNASPQQKQLAFNALGQLAANVVQPQIMPLFDSKSAIQVLSPIVYSEEKSAYETVKNVWKSKIISYELLFWWSFESWLSA